MGHYAFLNIKNEVIRVITGVDKDLKVEVLRNRKLLYLF